MRPTAKQPPLALALAQPGAPGSGTGSWIGGGSVWAYREVLGESTQRAPVLGGQLYAEKQALGFRG